MQLLYFRGTQPNFGDDLNAELWPRLLPGLFRSDANSGFLGIGTIIGMKIPQCAPLNVFSSGAGYDRLDEWQPNRKIWCVRGPLTARLLKCEPDAAVTDGAILAPSVLPELKIAGEPRIGVVPHWESLRFPGWQQACHHAGYRLISPIDTPVNVLAQLRATTLVLTESLHGAILADSVNVPWIPFVSTRNVSAFKWVDWCLSVDVTFAPVLVPPPSVEAALTFGRPDGEAIGQGRRYDAQTALDEYRSRTRAVSPGDSRASTTARSVLVAGLIKTARRSDRVGRVLGFHPARTAEALHTASKIAPTLSREALRTSLRDRMMDRLDALARVHAQGAEGAYG